MISFYIYYINAHLMSKVINCYIASIMEKDTKDFLIRKLPVDLAEKLKTAAALHRLSMKDYIIQLFQAHLEGLETKGISLSIEKRKRK